MLSRRRGTLPGNHGKARRIRASKRAGNDELPAVDLVIRQAVAQVHLGTPREKEVLSLLAKGYPYKRIASDLGIAIGTLRVHLRATYDKLHVHCRTEATVKYLCRD